MGSEHIKGKGIKPLTFWLLKGVSYHQDTCHHQLITYPSSVSNLTDVYSISRPCGFEKVCKVKACQDWLPMVGEMIRDQRFWCGHMATAWKEGATWQGIGRLIAPLVLGYLCQLLSEKETPSSTPPQIHTCISRQYCEVWRMPFLVSHTCKYTHILHLIGR